MDSGVVKLFPLHKRARCDCGDCNVCVLFLCETCGGAEASLPTHCPQERMTAIQCELVQSQLSDFRDGRWGPGKRKPVFGRRPTSGV